MPRFSSSLLLACLTAGLHAQTVPETHTFDHLEAGTWTGTDGWSASGNGGDFHVTSVNSGDGTPFIAFDISGAGVGATASRAFATPTSDERFSFSFSYAASNYWGTSVGIGSAASYGLALNVSTYNGLGAELLMDGVLIGSAPVTPIDGVSWYDFRLDIDLSANAGAGAVTLSHRATGNTPWINSAELSDFRLALDADRTAVSNTNPLKWNTFWFHHEGAGSGIDNITVGTYGTSAIPEPSTYVMFAGVAALGVALWRRQTRKNPAQTKPAHLSS